MAGRKPPFPVTPVCYGLQLIDGADTTRDDAPDVNQDDSSDAESNAGALAVEEDDSNRDGGAANAAGAAAAGFSGAGGASGADSECSSVPASSSSCG